MNTFGRWNLLVGSTALALTVLTLPTMVAAAQLKTPADKFVRTANYYLRAGTDITADLYPQLAEYDLLIFPAEAQVYNRPMFSELRRLNPNIIILAYVPTKSYNWSWFDELHQQLLRGIQDDWWLLDPQGNRVSVWGGTNVLNGASQWNAYLPEFVHQRIWKTGLWDGIFYDEFSGNVSWINGGNIDLHRDGVKDDPNLADTAWRRGMQNILRRTRELIGADAVVVTNGDSSSDLQSYINGRMFESFPTPWEAGGTWQGVTANYLRLQKMTGYPSVMIINAGSRNTGRNDDYRDMRLGLTTTLLGDGFFGYDFGETNHGQLWRYDEQTARLGRPLGSPINLAANSTELRPGFWRRDFELGVVLVNTTSQIQTAKFEVELERLRGTQDSNVNNGAIAASVTVPPNDGLILMRPLSEIIGQPFTNGSYVRVFDPSGNRVRNGFFAYVAPFGGSATLLMADFDGDGSRERLVAEAGELSVWNAAGRRVTSWRPYGTNYRGQINLAAGDLDGDGRDEIVTGAGAGGGPHVRVYETDGQEIANFFAYDQSFRGGVQVAVADFHADGYGSIITGAGAGGGPQVRIFNRYGRLLHPGFFAYDWRFRGGVNVAAGDLDGDGRDEIVTGAGAGGGPHVRVFDRYGRAQGNGFFAGDTQSRSGVRVAVQDFSGDGRAEIISLTTDVFSAAIAR